MSFHVVEADVIAFLVRPDGEVTAYRLEGAVARCERLMRQLSAQWDRFAVGDEFISRHLEALERTTRTILTDLHGELLGTDLRGARRAAGHGPDHRPAPPAAPACPSQRCTTGPPRSARRGP